MHIDRLRTASRTLHAVVRRGLAMQAPQRRTRLIPPAISAQPESGKPPKAGFDDFIGRFREIVSDPLNLLIERHPLAGTVDQQGFVMLHNGIKVPVAGAAAYYRDFSSILAVNRGVHEPLEEYVFQELLKRLTGAPTMLELGAYWGHYSMWLKKSLPTARVILVEPDAASLDVGRANFRLNGLEGEFICAFVGKGKFEVDGFLRERGIERLAILHADIQGSEGVMLRHAAAALRARAIDYAFVSTHSDQLTREVVAAFSAHNYRLEVISDFSNHTSSHDGLVFASSPNVEPLLGSFMPLGRAEIALSAPSEIVEGLTRRFRTG